MKKLDSMDMFMISQLNALVFTALSSFSGPLATKCVSLSNERCMARSTLIELNPIQLNYYLKSRKNSFIISVLLSLVVFQFLHLLH